MRDTSCLPGRRLRAVCRDQDGADGLGFDHLYDHVLKIHFQDIKSSIVTLLKGISNYYRYRNGERMLSKAQQQKMAEIFRKYGYEQELTFDHYEDRLVFPF